MLIEIDITDDQLGALLMGIPQAKGQNDGGSLPPQGVTIAHVQQIAAKGAGTMEVVQLLLSFGAGVASNLISNWLYDMLKNRATYLHIDGKRTAMNRHSLLMAIDDARSTGENGAASTLEP